MQPWNSHLDLGLADIDLAHRALDEMMQVALEAVARGSAPAVEAILASIAEATRAHFAVEEGMMRECGFGGAAEHQAAHAAFLKDIEGARQQFVAGGLGPVFQLWFGSRLAPWLRLHVRGCDAQFVRHYRHWQERQAKSGEAALIATAQP
jgi:hemerythrin